MLGLEKRVDAIRQMQGSEGVEPESPARNSARMAIMLALAAILMAVGVFVVIDQRYSAKMAAYESRLASNDARLTEALKAPADMAKKIIAANTLGELSQKVESLKAQLDASQQEKLAKIEALVADMRKDLAGK